MSDYAVWQALLRGESPAIHPDDPQPGYYLVHGTPLQIFDDPSGKLTAWLGNAGDDGAAMADKYWPEAAKHPITHDEWRKRFEGNIGDNNPPADDDSSTIDDAAQTIVSDANKLLANPIIDKAKADAAANLKDRALKLKKQADADYRAEALPIENQLTDIRARWIPITDRLTAAITKLRQAITKFQIAEEEKAQKAARSAVQAGKDLDEVPKPDIRVGGAGGRRTALRTYTVAEITDYDTLMQEVKNQPEVRKAVTSIANRAARSGIELPGMIIKKERKAV